MTKLTSLITFYKRGGKSAPASSVVGRGEQLIQQCSKEQQNMLLMLLLLQLYLFPVM